MREEQIVAIEVLITKTIYSDKASMNAVERGQVQSLRGWTFLHGFSKETDGLKGGVLGDGSKDTIVVPADAIDMIAEKFDRSEEYFILENSDEKFLGETTKLLKVNFEGRSPTIVEVQTEDFISKLGGLYADRKNLRTDREMILKKLRLNSGAIVFQIVWWR